jgi:PIN domain nuclease of toxin-antitoxin system
VRILLDSHVFLWAITSDARLSAVHREYFLDNENVLLLSMASIWEIVIKASLGKLPLPKPTAEFLAKQAEKNQITILPVRLAHLAELEQLPPVHRDPFDRMIAAQARAERLPILSADPVMKQYDVEIL